MEALMMLRVSASGVAQHPPPRFDILNQLPPVEVYTAELNKKFVPVLATDKICGSGFAPPAGMLKLMGFTCTKTLVPTVTLTGMVTTSPEPCKTTCPLKVPAMAPPFGRALGVTDILTVVGAVPLAADALSHAPPSAVLVARVQCNVPDPAFLIWMGWVGGALPPVAME